ncbi:Relaxosome protein TraY [Vibrio crassostreae]|nr:Relaxosome protein TraY [Vibrio crassostreae]
MSLQKKQSKVSLNIKISSDLDVRLKRARKAAREQGLMFNVSQEVEKFLEKEIKEVERQLSIDEEIKNNLEDLGGLNIDKMMKSMD